LAIVHGSHNLGPTCGTYTAERMWKMWWKRRTIDPKGDRVPLGDNRGATLERGIKEFDSVRFKISCLLVLYTQI